MTNHEDPVALVVVRCTAASHTCAMALDMSMDRWQIDSGFVNKNCPVCGSFGLVPVR